MVELKTYPVTPEELINEFLNYFTNCGSCAHFEPFRGEAGFCAVEENNCLCIDPNAMIDIWDNRCIKWAVDPRLIEDITESSTGCSCPFCGAAALEPVAKTVPELVESPVKFYTWTEVHHCSNCKDLYVLNNQQKIKNA